VRKVLVGGALLLATGCDDPVVAENIDVFTCAWLPSWMADCTAPEVHDKAVEVLQYGLVQAKVTCSGVENHRADSCDLTTNGTGTYSAHRLVDGSGLVTLERETFMLGRAEEAGANMSVAHPSYPSDSWSIAGGKLVVHKDGCDDVVVDIATECDGFNLDVFGVQELSRRSRFTRRRNR
jgi:hypothetical protein